MLTTVKTPKAELWPTLAPSKEPAFSFSSYASGPQRDAPKAATRHDDTDDDDDDLSGACAPPAYRESFGSAIAEALDLNAAISKSTQSKNPSTGNGGRAKKKKGKNTVLFTTNCRTFDN